MGQYIRENPDVKAQIMPALIAKELGITLKAPGKSPPSQEGGFTRWRRGAAPLQPPAGAIW